MYPLVADARKDSLLISPHLFLSSVELVTSAWHESSPDMSSLCTDSARDSLLYQREQMGSNRFQGNLDLNRKAENHFQRSTGCCFR